MSDEVIRLFTHLQSTLEQSQCLSVASTLAATKEQVDATAFANEDKAETSQNKTASKCEDNSTTDWDQMESIEVINEEVVSKRSDVDVDTNEPCNEPPNQVAHVNITKSPNKEVLTANSSFDVPNETGCIKDMNQHQVESETQSVVFQNSDDGTHGEEHKISTEEKASETDATEPPAKLDEFNDFAKEVHLINIAKAVEEKTTQSSSIVHVLGGGDQSRKTLVKDIDDHVVIEIDDDDGGPEHDKCIHTITRNIERNLSASSDVDDEKAKVDGCKKLSKSIENMNLDTKNILDEGMECEKLQNIADPIIEEDDMIDSSNPKPDTPLFKNAKSSDFIDNQTFYNKECINYECLRAHTEFFRVSQFVLSYFKVTKKKSKQQYICVDCYESALSMYEDFCGLLSAKQPLLLKEILGGRQDFVEIIDSSDEENNDGTTDREKEENYFSKDDLMLIENELDNCIHATLKHIEIQNQLTWAKAVLSTRVQRLKETTALFDSELRVLQQKADHMHNNLYQAPNIKIRQLQPLDLNSGLPYASTSSESTTTEESQPPLPPLGEIQRLPVQVNEVYYVVKNKAIASWVLCRVLEQLDVGIVGAKNAVDQFKIKFLKMHYPMIKTVSVKHLAYYNAPSVRLPIGTRVIAYFDATSLSRGKEKMMIQSAFYPGIVAEPLRPNNKFRYLIFYDDGYTQYVYHKDVRLVCHVSDNVWEDVHPASRDFIQKYLTQFAINRPMVQTQKGQSMATESNGKWIYARVLDIDCSLVQMQFEGTKSHTEWIYRGSMRLGPVNKECQKSMQKDILPTTRLSRRTEPFIRYTEDEESTTNTSNQKPTETRFVAKKSSSRGDAPHASIALKVPLSASGSSIMPVRHLNNSTIYVEDEARPKGKVVYYTAKKNLPPRKYQPHVCSTACVYTNTHNLSAYSPLSKPLLLGWERMIIRQKIKKMIAYRGPCGCIMRDIKQVHEYLRLTNNSLNVDNFDFYPETSCLAEYVIENSIVQRRDISNGQEKMPIPLVNYYDNSMPPACKYAAQRIPTEGVHLNLDKEFLVGCDCEDDCSNPSKCACWQLTYAGAKYGNPTTSMEDIGYQYKRLYEHVPTGIYECNSRCKCNSNCLNRVVQHSLEMKLQVFKTSNRGWGLRCINDIPKGTFICIYAGHLLTEAKANEGGLDAGDEYFAELDYIEVAEQIKEGYESDMETPDLDDEEIYTPDPEDDDEFTPSKPVVAPAQNKMRSTRSNIPGYNGDDDSQERQVINFNPNADMKENSGRESSIRKLFGKDEACYVMDAKITGNLGRYFNHSCAPNLFVQNVFVDTHDLRFPWVAFFALTHIHAGTELTWNYNYEVGVVPGKVLYCQCGAPSCRLRLL